MKKVILFLMLVSLSSSALAFGGLFGDNSKKSGRKSVGVDNFGAHIKPDQPTPPNIGFYDISKDVNAVLCAEGTNIYCCKAGYVINIATSSCIPCKENEVAPLEENFVCIACQNEQVPSLDKSFCITPEEVCSSANPTLCLDETVCLEAGATWCNGQCQSPEAVCCPDGGILAEGGMGVESCCKDNLAYDSESGTYKAYEPTVCGCPNKAEYHPEGSFCCDKQWTLSYYKGKIVNIMNPDQCGCRFSDMLKIDESGKKYCCGTSKHYDFGQDYSMSRGYLPKPSQFCCESVGGQWCAQTSECIRKEETCAE